MISLNNLVGTLSKIPFLKQTDFVKSLEIAQKQLALQNNQEITKQIASAVYYDMKYFNNWQQSYYDPNPIHKNPKFEGIAVFYTMGTDSKLASNTNQRIDTLINKPWYARPAIENDRLELIKAGFVKQCLLKINNLNAKKKNIKSDIIYGNSFAEKILGFEDVIFTINRKISKTKRVSEKITIKNAAVIKDIIPIPPTAFSFDGKRQMYFEDSAGIIRPVTPQERYNLIFSVFDDKFGSPYGWSLYTALFSHWIMKKAILQWRLVYLEKRAIGTVLGTYPSQYNKNSQEVKDFDKALDNLMWSAKITAPEDFAVKFVNDLAMQATMDVFQNAINYIDQCFGETILGHKQATEATSIGSLASSTVKEQALRQAILDTDAMSLDTVMDEQVVEQLIDMNFPSNGLYPTHTTHVELDKDLQERRETFKMVSEQGLTLSENQLRRELHVDAPIDDLDAIEPQDATRTLQYIGKNAQQQNNNQQQPAKLSKVDRRRLAKKIILQLEKELKYKGLPM